MVAFRFRLDPVLRLRERHREAQRLAFAAVEDERVRLVEEIRRLDDRLTASTRDMGRADGPGLTSADLRLYGEFVQHLTFAIQRRRELLKGVEGRRETCRLALLEADKEVKSLEQLRVRLGERRDREETATAQRQTDEVGQRKYLEQQRATEQEKTGGGDEQRRR
jgi:flagellar export protein FliJ